MAALRNQITNIIVPERNRKDLEEIPENLREQINFTFASDMDDVLSAALIRGDKIFKKKSKKKTSEKKAKFKKTAKKTKSAKKKTAGKKKPVRAYQKAAKPSRSTARR